MTEPSEGAPATAEAAPPPVAAADSAGAVPARSAAASASAAALERYAAGLRKRRIVYFSILAVLLAALGTFVGVAWSRGEVAHASLHTFRPPPHNLPLAAPSSNLQQAWVTSDRLADGVPQWRGTIITFSAHTVGGRNARTGARTWTYTRTDRTICAVGQAGGTTVAAFENRGNCDELDAFYSGTGGRRWTRTLDFDGLPVNGRPVFQTTPATYLVTTRSAIYAIDPVTGYNRWTYHRDACGIHGAVLGSTGALISQNCSARVRCSAEKFCARGPQLFLRDGSANRDDNAKDNPDKIKWLDTRNVTVPVSADQVTTSASPDGAALFLLDDATGKQLHRIPLSPASGALGSVAAVAAADAEVLWLSGRTYALRAGATRFDWSVGTAAPPTVVSSDGLTTPAVAAARITVAGADGISVIGGGRGRVATTPTPTPPAPGSTVYPVGTGYVVGSPAGVVAYR